jgi:hypothetical protein
VTVGLASVGLAPVGVGEGRVGAGLFRIIRRWQVQDNIHKLRYETPIMPFNYHAISSAVEPSRPRKARTCSIVKKLQIHVKELGMVIKFVQIHLKDGARDQLLHEHQQIEKHSQVAEAIPTGSPMQRLVAQSLLTN